MATEQQLANLAKAREAKQAKQARQGTDTERVPLGVWRQRLGARVPQGMTGRWINDEGDRVIRAQRAGYIFLDDDGRTVAVNEDVGQRVSKVVGKDDNGHPIRAYLMALDTKLYQQDQTAKATQIDETEELIRHADHGRKPGDGRYDTKDRISLASQRA